MEKVRILGISGSPRHANTEIAVKEALDGAAELPDVETEFYSMAGKKINPCSCPTNSKCRTEGTPDNPCPRWGLDAIALLYKKMLTFDGFIIGSPVYMGGVSAQMKALWDRVAPLCYAITPCMGLRNKVVGGVTVAGYREGGQEHTLTEIWKFAITMDMVPVGLGPILQDRVCMWGGALTNSYSAPNIYRTYARGTPEEMAVARGDELGLLSCRNTGRRVAEMARVIQVGFKTVPREATHWPYGAAGGIAETNWKR